MGLFFHASCVSTITFIVVLYASGMSTNKASVHSLLSDFWMNSVVLNREHQFCGNVFSGLVLASLLSPYLPDGHLLTGADS